MGIHVVLIMRMRMGAMCPVVIAVSTTTTIKVKTVVPAMIHTRLHDQSKQWIIPIGIQIGMEDIIHITGKGLFVASMIGIAASRARYSAGHIAIASLGWRSPKWRGTIMGTANTTAMAVLRIVLERQDRMKLLSQESILMEKMVMVLLMMMRAFAIVVVHVGIWMSFSGLWWCCRCCGRYKDVSVVVIHFATGLHTPVGPANSVMVVSIAVWRWRG